MKNINTNQNDPNKIDFRNYEFSSGTLQTRKSIQNDPNKIDFEKHLTLNYKTCYGTKKAAKHYYTTGLLCSDNFIGVGVSHLIKVSDIIKFYKSQSNNDDQERANEMQILFFEPEGYDLKTFYDNYKYKHDSPWVIKKFKRKLWVVELLDGIPNTIKFLNWISYPLKYIPQRSILRIDKYTKYRFSIGGVTNVIVL